MAKQIYVNLPVKDLAKSIEFYEKLGFKNNPAFTSETGASMQWSDDIVVMLLTHEFYKTFLRDKEIIDAKTTSGALLAITFDTKEEVQKFADTAKENGGDYFKSNTGVPEEMMFGYEVEDLDGNTWEPIWMNPEFKPQQS